MLFTVTKNKVELASQEPVNQGEYKATVLTFDFVILTPHGGHFVGRFGHGCDLFL